MEPDGSKRHAFERQLVHLAFVHLALWTLTGDDDDEIGVFGDVGLLVASASLVVLDGGVE